MESLQDLQEQLKRGLERVTDEDLKIQKPEGHRSYRGVGREIMRDWGWNTNKSRDELIEDLSHEKMMTPLLAFIGHALESMEGTAKDLLAHARTATRDRQLKSSATASRHSISDGYHHVMIRQLAQFKGEILIEDCDRDQLPSRARRAIRRLMIRSNVVNLSDITEEGLLEMDGCGPTTTQELLAWRDGILNPNGDVNDRATPT